MKIVYTKHAQDKFVQERYTIHLTITKKVIKQVIQKPQHITKQDEKTIAVASLDQLHSLVVVYRQSGKEILVITFFPTRKGRYETKVLQGWWYSGHEVIR